MAATPTKKAKKTTTRRTTTAKKTTTKAAKKPTVKKTTRSRKPDAEESIDEAPKPKRATRTKAAKKTTTTRASKAVTAEETKPKAATKAAKKTTTRARKSTTATAEEKTPRAKTTRSRKKVEEPVSAETPEVVDSANLSEQFTEENAGDAEVTIDRRKNDGNRHKKAKEERPKVERRAKVNRRRQIDPTTCERDYSADEIEFMNALELYKRENGRPFPTCSEVLEVIRGLGYQKPIAGELVDLKDDKESPFEELANNDLEERLNQPKSSWIDRIGDRQTSNPSPELIGNS